MEGPALRKAAATEITARRRRAKRDVREVRQTITARLSLTSASLVRLLSITGAQSEFVLASVDGSATVSVGVAVVAVPDGELVFRNGRVVLDWSRSTIANGRNRTALSRTELRLLSALMERAPEPSSREQLAARLWGRSASRGRDYEKDVSVWVFALRKHFAAIGLRNAIQTVRGIGYCLSI